mmetsp:Transcript_54406/g.117752  ORF Transcript_54406/g.117752 Transcript_54406/m.117752 type:complete len:523 (+) Transcript_54406:38-1606(+)
MVAAETAPARRVTAHVPSCSLAPGARTSSSVRRTSKKFVSDPAGIAALASGVAFLLLMASALVYFIRGRMLLRNPYISAARYVAKGHAAKPGDVAEATRWYRAALVRLCRRALEGFADSDIKDAVAKVDQIIIAYNGAVHLGLALSIGFPSQSEEPVPTLIPISYTKGLGAELDEHLVVKVCDHGPAARLGLQVGDQLVALNGEDITTFSLEFIQEQLALAGRASFRRRDGDSDRKALLTCSRCGCGNSVAEPSTIFRCFSCCATAVPWSCLTTPVKPQGGTFPLRRLRFFRDSNLQGHLGLKDVTWEDSGLAPAQKHPTGFGAPRDVPGDCQHHTQVGATCGVAAVNNLITNSGAASVDAEHLMQISSRLGQAETAIREGVASVEEAGEQQQVSELYSTSVGNFDVQTLQIAFDEAGFNMWYMPPQQLKQPSALWSKSDLVGYVVHRRDPMNPRLDHWFVLRAHAGASGTVKRRFLLHDSLFEVVFELTAIEAHQLLVHQPTGSLFAVSQRAAIPGTIAEP